MTAPKTAFIMSARGLQRRNMVRRTDRFNLICPFCPRAKLLNTHQSERWLVGAVGIEPASPACGRLLFDSTRFIRSALLPGGALTLTWAAESEDMMVKAQLATKIAEIIRQRGLTQERAAKLLGLTQPKVSKLLKGQFRGISERRLLRCLSRLGRDIEIVVKPTPRHRAERLTVHFA